ncbi:hypothetical protein MTO96_052318 [Rhipicephalus appendiculatus]
MSAWLRCAIIVNAFLYAYAGSSRPRKHTRGFLGKQCQTNDECGAVAEFCCVIPKYAAGQQGVCHGRARLGERCSITMYRSALANNYYAPYVGACPCFQPVSG